MKTRVFIIIVLIAILAISIGTVMWPEYGMVCNNTTIKHLQKYSNLFDENTIHETYGILEIGYPFGVHGGNVKECVDFILEKRTLMELENKD